MQNPVQMIAEKRAGRAHSSERIREWIAAYSDGRVPDYQMAAWAMAVCFQGMTSAETAALTHAMLDSGTRMERPADGVRVDKHSTGGIGDKVSLVLAPLLACCDLQVPMISGRGLGATGGTLDKLESIPGFRTDLEIDEISRVVAEVGCVITGATEHLAPADRKLYALRDVTATVASLPLITASILSKKLSESLDALVLDVKCGGGAFMKTLDDARRLARSMVEVAGAMGVAASALITDMNQPLGSAVGNAVEVNEAIACLQGVGPDDLRALVLELGAETLLLTQRAGDRAEATHRLAELLASGDAHERWERMVAAQGGDLQAERPIASESVVTADQDGWVCRFDAERLGWLIIELGGGRRRQGDAIDASVGVEVCVRLGDRISSGDPLARVYCHPEQRPHAHATLRECIRLGESSTPPTAVLQRITSADA